MAERPNETDTGDTIVVRRGTRWGRVATLAALALMALLIVVVAIVWVERRSIATRYLKSEFERRGVTASYHLDRVGLRTQEVTNLVIRDPKPQSLAPLRTDLDRAVGCCRDAGCPGQGLVQVLAFQ